MTRLSAIDRILSVVDHADFGVILHCRKIPPAEALRAGARSARTLYPVTGSRIDGALWKPSPTPNDGVTVAASSDPAREAESFMDRPFHPRDETPIQQFLAPGGFIITRAHHAALDGFSLGLWLRHQLRVAAGAERPAAQSRTDGALKLRRCSIRTLDRSPGSPALWTRDANGGPIKRWLTIELPGVLSTDTLAAAALRTITRWNHAHGAPSRGMSLWMPVNVRERDSAGFGNGTSRIRVRMDGEPDIRREIRRSLRSGEWSVPGDPLLLRLPCAVSNPLLRMYLHRPWARMGSVVFSCIELWPERDDSIFEDVDRIELVGQLHRRHALAINAMPYRGRTAVTLTYDASRLSADDVSGLASDLARSRYDTSDSPPVKEGWLRAEIKRREASKARADGVVIP
jgi:hypothetical protein